MKRNLVLVSLYFFVISANATLFTDRTTFESSVSITYNETFETGIGALTAVPITGPITMPTGLTVSSGSNDLFLSGPGWNTNPTEAIGSNKPPNDNLMFSLGSRYTAFGADFFQNNGNGDQFDHPIWYLLYFFQAGFNFDSIISLVEPNGGSFIGYISPLISFDSVMVVADLNSYEIADNVTVGNRRTIPEPDTLVLMGLGLAGLGLSGRRSH